MIMAEMRDTDDRLESFFAAARMAPPAPSAAFLARLADAAEAVQAEGLRPNLRAALQPSAARGGGVLGQLAALIGGWGALGGMAGGLATATVAGLWIGLAGAETMVQAVGLGSVAVQGTETGTAFLPEADILALAVGQ